MMSRRPSSSLVAGAPWLIHLDEWDLWGRVIRPRLPDVWVYRHHVSGGEIFVDDTGQAYRFIPNRTGNLGRFKEIPIRQAIWRSGLPEAPDGARGVLQAVR